MMPGMALCEHRAALDISRRPIDSGVPSQRLRSTSRTRPIAGRYGFGVIVGVAVV